MLISKVVFNGQNAEEFISKFPHICAAYQVDRIFYQEYGRQRPAAGNPDRQVWDGVGFQGVQAFGEAFG
jgi:hypothetical protein